MQLFNFIGSIIFFSVAICVLVKLDIPDSSIVIALIGALATFVVIGNYEQVRDIKKEYAERLKKIDALEKRIQSSDDENFVHIMQVLIDVYRERGQILNAISTYMSIINRHLESKSPRSQINFDAKKLLDYLESSDANDLSRIENTPGKLDAFISEIGAIEQIDVKTRDEIIGWLKRLKERIDERRC